MAVSKTGISSSFLDKVLGRIGRLDPEGLQTVVERLARERNFLEKLFNVIEDGILVVDEELRILYYNQGVTALLGLQPGKAEGEPVKRFLPQVDWETISGQDSDGNEQAIRREFEITYPQSRFIRLYATPLDEEDLGASGMALILHDATEAREKTFEAIESERIQTLTLLAASVAHEIGNPLNALSIHMQLMERELRKLRRSEKTLNPGGKGLAEAKGAATSINRLENYLDVAKGEISRLDYIVTQFLQAIRPSPPSMELTSLNTVVRETLGLLRPEIENRGVRIEMDLPDKLAKAPMDGAQIKQVLVNLVKNALQAMTTGGILTLRTGESRGGVWIEVEDTGGGIARDKLARIFEPYFTTKKKGSGLGLMIVERVVRAHRGLVDVKSNLGQGTTFRIWLPLHEQGPLLLGGGSDEEGETT